MGRRGEISFIVQTIDCIICSPIFRRSLLRVPGVLEVRELTITNRIIVVFDGDRLNAEQLRDEINRVARRGGLGGKIFFPSR